MAGCIHDGHRQRLMNKILKDACCEHEFLEMFLCYAIPRRNTNDLAHRLLSTFGDIPSLLKATPEELLNVEGVGKSTVALISCMSKFCQEYAATLAEQGEFPKTYQAESFSQFVNDYYIRVAYEVFDVYYVNKGGKIFRRQRFTSQSGGKVCVDVDEMSLLITRLKPSGIVIVHNHPFGKCEPSESDDEATKSFQCICAMQNVLLCNHYISAANGVYDYYASGKLKEINKLCNRET